MILGVGLRFGNNYTLIWNITAIQPQPPILIFNTICTFSINLIIIKMSNGL